METLLKIIIALTQQWYTQNTLVSHMYISNICVSKELDWKQHASGFFSETKHILCHNFRQNDFFFFNIMALCKQEGTS